ncbi:MAG: lytic transglycosylase domain-containing protein [Nitrospirae bacterium]|nr:lytic transglycosylase domain-containing protein [Nitrospirota bacterium]
MDRKISLFRIALLILIFTLVIASHSFALQLDWQNLLDHGEKCSGLPGDLILSVIWVESRGNPYAVNINGVGGFFPKSLSDSLKIIYHFNKTNVDIGLMQINWMTWGPVYGLKPVDFFDPFINICIGSKILRHYIDKHNGSWRGVGRYNAVSYDKQVKYALKVADTYKIISKMRQQK